MGQELLPGILGFPAGSLAVLTFTESGAGGEVKAFALTEAGQPGEKSSF